MLHLHGEKLWSVYRPLPPAANATRAAAADGEAAAEGVELPRRDMRRKPARAELAAAGAAWAAPAAAARAGDGGAARPRLASGDALYLPRGWTHEAATPPPRDAATPPPSRGELSVHVTLGLEFDDISWEALLHAALAALPVDAAADATAARCARALPHAALAELAGRGAAGVALRATVPLPPRGLDDDRAAAAAPSLDAIAARLRPAWARRLELLRGARALDSARARFASFPPSRRARDRVA